MRMKVISNGLTYVGKEVTGKETLDEYAYRFYKGLDAGTSLILPLENGSFLVMGKDALQNAHLIFEN